MDDTPSYKLIIIGDTGVGKTSLALRQCRGNFSFQMAPTVGAGHLKTMVKVNDRDVELKIWDTAGQEQFASLVSMYSKDARACIIVASCVDHLSIEHIDSWRDRLHEQGERPPIIVAINKTDMKDGGMEWQDEIRSNLSEKYSNIFFVSARSGDGVQSLFVSAAREAMKAAGDPFEDGVDLNQQDARGSCC